MALFITFLAFVLASALSFAQLEPRLVQPLQLILLLVLAVLLLLEGVSLIRRRQEEPKAPPVQKPVEPQPTTVATSVDTAVEAGVVQFLARMQEKGRLVDFLLDDIAPFTNEQIGVAARVVHQGCREVLKGSFNIEPVHAGAERDAISLAGDFDASSYRLMGKVPEHPPYRGTVLHRGWKATRISLPRVTDAARESAARTVIAPAEVEIG